MKFTLLALVAAVEARHHHHHHHGDVLLQSQVQGIDKKTLQPDQHWRNPWPQGTDDSTDDDKILNWMRKPKDPEPPIRYHDKMRQWQAGTWPVHLTGADDWTHDSYHNQVDDGTDDN